MASLHKLLSKDGFQQPQHTKKAKAKVKGLRERKKQEADAITLPIYICHDRRSLDSSSRRERSRERRDVGPAIDDVATKAMVAILSGYVAHYSRDASFRAGIREKCRSCCAEIFHLIEMGVESVECLAEASTDLESLQRCINILNAVADSASPKPITACAHLYLAIVYKIAKNDKISARNLLQVFCDAPSLARKRLLPDLWDHFFLPHLLHLKIWYTNNLAYKDNNIKALKHLYHHQMDFGTLQFALYYKEWLKLGAQAPSMPTVPLPLNLKSTRKSSDSSTSHHSSTTKLQMLSVTFHLPTFNCLFFTTN